jgi:hypothetical protein
VAVATQRCRDRVGSLVPHRGLMRPVAIARFAQRSRTERLQQQVDPRKLAYAAVGDPVGSWQRADQRRSDNAAGQAML